MKGTEVWKLPLPGLDDGDQGDRRAEGPLASGTKCAPKKPKFPVWGAADLGP